MTGLVVFLHAIVSLALIVIILMQSGRGGGLTEGFASAESMFGAKTNEFMVKGTTIFAGIFLVTCLGLAILNAREGKSLMSGNTITETQELPPVEIAEPIAEEAQNIVEQVEGIVEEVKEEAPAAVEAIEDSLPAENTSQE